MTANNTNGGRYSYGIDPQGDSTANKVLNLVGRNKRVLELGCGPGMMTRYLREQLDCRVTAVEFDAELAKQAEPYCERLIVADLETLDYAASFAADADADKFDVIIAADVLEHLRDPWACLRQLRPLLTDTGYLVVSIPNIAHNVIIGQLLAGRFPYQEQGLLDRTHLRFFARRDIEDLLFSTGFMPEVWQRTLTAETASEFAGAWLQLPQALRDAVAQAEDGQVYQFIVKAFPTTEAAWLEQNRRRLAELSAEREELKGKLHQTEAKLEEYAKAFHEARDLLQEREKAVAEYAQAQEQAKATIASHEAKIAEYAQAFEQARDELEASKNAYNALNVESQALSELIDHLKNDRFPERLLRVGRRTLGKLTPNK